MPLKDLDLSNNDLLDSAVQLLSAGLKSSYCKLETLRLSGCMVTDKGCSSLASALKSNPSHLRELDLTYNHPGEFVVKLLSDLLEDPHCKLEKLQVDHGGKIRIKPGLKKYAVNLTLDPNTVDRHLSLSERNKELKWRVNQGLEHTFLSLASSTLSSWANHMLWAEFAHNTLRGHGAGAEELGGKRGRQTLSSGGVVGRQRLALLENILTVLQWAAVLLPPPDAGGKNSLTLYTRLYVRRFLCSFAPSL
ncbi:hypothetical protein SRHO_G00211490 [Serrasalmus rhombeus]